ncbi:hypothetical protein BDF20DRAFT_816239 [Mycotypha africana]|uniref:uncharacterized protein n=1 Tax=Mycotypha africana TaxID=64632 RepID=UPI002300A034|nr:uncharacterized protein BDF20DRAFT_816239 [Mycotypha africana]KAI8984624.1 hypothetical protein BDF20DRAFT_816239 [Mycotypha africana]
MSFVTRFSDSVGHFFERHPHAVHLTLTAAAASALTAASILTYQGSQRRSRAKTLKDELREAELHSSMDLTPVGTATPISKQQQQQALHLPRVYDDKLIEEQLSKNTAFLGEEGAKKLRNAFVIVVGAGGVGSWAALMLARSGVKRIRIIDFDQVTLSSLNRHAVATLEDVGTPKVRCIKKCFKDIVPFVEVEDCIDLLNAENVDILLGGNPDYVVDAIDNINTKVDLIRYCYERKLPVISSMGAGAKSDPSRIQIADISETFGILKKLNILKGVPVAYSTEKPSHVKLLPLARILPVLGTIPSMFGMAIANYIILRVTNYPDFDPLPVKLRDGLYVRVHRDLLTREAKVYNEK